MSVGKFTSRDYVGAIGIFLGLWLVGFVFSLIGWLSGVENTVYRISSVGGAIVSGYLLFTRKATVFLVWVRSRQGMIVGYILILVVLTLWVLRFLRLDLGWIDLLFWALSTMGLVIFLVALCDEFAQLRLSGKR